MKLIKNLFAKRKLLAMMVGLAVSGGVVQAQYTGIGHTDPQATLHIIPVTPGQEPLRVEGMIDLAAEVTYTDVLLYDPASGLMRRESVADLLDDNGEWIENGASDAIIPRRYTTAMSVNNALVDITATATRVGGTLDVSGATTINNSLTVTGVGNATSVDGTMSIGTVANVPLLSIDGADEVLIQQAGTNLVEHITIDDLLASSGYWDFDGTTLLPSDSDLADDFTLVDETLTIGATTTAINSNTTNTGTFTVSGAANPTTLDGVLNIGTVANLPLLSIDGADEVLIQQAGTNLVEHITIDDLLASSGYWDFDGTTLLPSDSDLADDFTLVDETLTIGATTTAINSNTTNTGTFTVSGAANPTTLDGVLNIGTVANLPLLSIDGADEVLIQQAGTNLVEHITIDDLLASSGYWDFDGTTLLPSDSDLADDFTLVDETLTIGATTTAINSNTTNTGTFTVSGAANPTTLDGVLNIGTVANLPLLSIDGADEVLIQQAGTNLVEHITIDDLLASSGYWDFDGTTLLPSDSDLADDFTLIDETLTIGTTTTAINSNTTNTGTFTVSGAANPTTLDGVLNIGTVAQVAAADVAPTDEILMQQAGTNLVEYVTVQDLVSSNSEWVFDDVDSDGTFDATEKVYVRRLGNDASGDDVFVDGIGNMVVDATKAFQFGAAARQINASGITADADYTVDINGGSLTFDTDADEDVAFNEAGEPWLYYASNDAYGPTSPFGNAGNERGRVGINTNAPEATLHVAGNIVASNVTVTSDRRFKKDIKEISGALALVKSLRGVSYDFRTNEFPKENFDDRNHIGFIAQEIQAVLPQTVMERGDGFLTVDYAAVTPVLVEALQELSAQVEALQAENATLRSASAKDIGAVSTKQLRELEARLADMDARLQEVAGRK